jgi:hypothetical protein
MPSGSEREASGTIHDIRIIEDRWATFRHIIEAVAIIAAGVWAFYTFVYQEKIKPANEPASLNDSVVMQRLGRDNVRDIIALSAIFHNAGKTEIDIAADGYNVWGSRYGRTPAVASRHAKTQETYRAGYLIVSKHLVRTFFELRDAARGGEVGNHIILEPDDTVTLHDVIAVPRGAYDILTARVIAVPLKTPAATGKLPVSLVRQKDGSFLIDVPDDAFEDDNDSSFALSS